MTSIGAITGTAGVTPAANAATDPRQAALGTIGEIGHRVLAWVDASGGGADSAATWSASTATSSYFRPDASVLARGGDVYGLGELSGDLADRFGATPAQQGDLHRSLEGFTREAVIQLAGLSGADGDRQLFGVRDALAAAGDGADGGGVDGIIQRLDAATAVLARQNGR